MVFIGTQFKVAWDSKVRELEHNGYKYLGPVKLPYNYAGAFRKIDSEDIDSTPNR